MENEVIRLELPFVSIVILNWDGKKVLKECLNSIIQLSYPNYEVIVVDNGSCDGSPEMVAEDFPRVKLIVNKRNLGFAAGCNVGIRYAKGEMIGLFNNDAVADRYWLLKLVELMLDSPQIGIVGGPVLYYDRRNVVWSAGNKIDLVTGLSWAAGRGKLLGQLNSDDIDYINFSAVLLRREVFKKIGLLDERYFVGWEDADWNVFAAKAGYMCSTSLSSLAWHRISYSRRKATAKSYYFSARAFFRFCLKYFPIKYIATTLFFQLFVIPAMEILLFRQSVMCLTQRLKGFLWNFSQMRDILVERERLGAFGKLVLKNRFRECLTIALNDRESGRAPLL